MVQTALRRYFFLILPLACSLILAGCLGNKNAGIDPQADRIDVVNLPRFGTDPHWGGKAIPQKIRIQRAELIRQLAENNADPNAFALEVTQTGWQAMAQSDFSTAMRRFNQAWLVQPQTPYAIMGMAMVVFERDGDYKGGLMLMESLQEPLANDGSYWINLASMKQRAGLPDQALNDFQRAAQFSPNNPIILSNLVTLYSQAQNFPAACAMLTKSRRLDIDIDSQTARNIEQNASSNCTAS